MGSERSSWIEDEHILWRQAIYCYFAPKGFLFINLEDLWYFIEDIGICVKRLDWRQTYCYFASKRLLFLILEDMWYFVEVSETSYSCGHLLGETWYGCHFLYDSSSFRRWVIALSFNDQHECGGPTEEAVIEGDYKDFVLLVWYGIICSGTSQQFQKFRLLNSWSGYLINKDRNLEVVDTWNSFFAMFCLNFCQMFKDLFQRTALSCSCLECKPLYISNKLKWSITGILLVWIQNCQS